MVCHHCGMLPEGGIDEGLLCILDNMCTLAGFKLEVSCMYRCSEHNRQVYEELGMPVVENSQHVFGRAADVQLPEGWTVEQLAELAEECGADGIGVYDWGVHVDTRGYIARW